MEGSYSVEAGDTAASRGRGWKSKGRRGKNKNGDLLGVMAEEGEGQGGVREEGRE